MRSFTRLSTQCFPAKIWKRNANNTGYAQQQPTTQDWLRREALAAWQLGCCTLDEAREALRQIENLERRLDKDIENTLLALSRKVAA